MERQGSIAADAHCNTCDADPEVDHVAEPAVEGVDALEDDDPARGDLNLLVPHAGARLEVVDRHLVG